MQTRRELLHSGVATAVILGATTITPWRAFAAPASDNTFETEGGGKVVVHPVSHASFVMETPGMVIYADPVGGANAYSTFPRADLILITHEHGDHYDAETLSGLVGENTRLLTNPAVHGMLPDNLKAKATAIGNGESTTIGDIAIDAVSAYNTTEDRLKYHPKGRDNGYVLTIDGLRVYIAGDTEDIPEMRALKDIDVAFVPMNLPYTMDVEQAASAVNEFAPKYVYPYHYRDSDINRFAELVGEGGGGSEVLFGNWYA